MNCFPCFSSKKSDSGEDEEQLPVAQPKEGGAPSLPSQSSDAQNLDHENIAAKAFTFREMATATKNFRQECVIYDDGFGRVFKGTLKSSGQVVAIKQLDRNGMKAAKEFLDEVSTLSPLKHPNLIELLGYCADGDQRILVYDYIPLGSLEAHLLDRSADKSPLDWLTRMKIATGAAQGLEYLHEKANPPVIYRDFKSSKILLDEEYNPKLCDFGLVKLAQSGNTASSVPPRVMGTYGYSAPEYASTGELTLKSDIYSFGVVLLELITGRRAIDPNRPANEQNLVTWAQPIFRDPKRFPEMADPLLNNEFSVKSLNQAVGVVAMCLQEEPTVRPYITDVVAALSFLDFDAKDPPAPTPSSDKESESDGSYSDQNEDDNNDNDDGRSSDHEDINETRDDDECASSSSDHDDNGTNMNENIDDDDKSGSSMDHEDSALTIELDNRNSSSDNLLDEDSGHEDYDDDEVQRKCRAKSIKSANSKKGKVMELSDDESMYSSGSSRSSSSNDESGVKKTSRQTTKKVRSTRSSVGNSSTRKSKNRWRRAKLAVNNETKTD